MALILHYEELSLDLIQSNPLIVIHGGAGPQDPSGKQIEKAKTSIKAILRRLRTNGSIPAYAVKGSLSIQKCLQGAWELEEDPAFNAGYGAALQADGVARVSASFMESTHQKFSAVMNCEQVMHPSALAFALQDETHCILDQRGAERLARQLGIEPQELTTDERLTKWMEHKKKSLPTKPSTGKTGTIGSVCLSLDPTPKLAVCTSTGGVGNETPGRVGDTPTIAGNYCDNLTAISCTGIGEQIINHSFASRVAIRIQDGSGLRESLSRSLKEVQKKGDQLAAIAVSIDFSKNTAYWAVGATTPSMIWGALTPQQMLVF